MNRADLLKRMGVGESFVFLPFWKGPLSQWARLDFEIDGVKYITAEHWMMAEKARTFGDDETRPVGVHPQRPCCRAPCDPSVGRDPARAGSPRRPHAAGADALICTPPSPDHKGTILCRPERTLEKEVAMRDADLPAWIIDDLMRRREEEAQRLPLQLPLMEPMPHSMPESEPEESEQRGVVIIPL